MRDRFSDLIKKGVANFHHGPVGTPVPSLDPVVKLYNNLWGALTDTHMSKVDQDRYIITGTYVKTPQWENFKYAYMYGSTNIRLGSGYDSLEGMINAYGFVMNPGVYNGDYVIMLTPRENELSNSELPATMESLGTELTTYNSQIPHRFGEFFTHEQIKTIEECWKGDCVLENLNKRVRGVSFRLSADNQYVVVGDNKLKIKI